MTIIPSLLGVVFLSVLAPDQPAQTVLIEEQVPIVQAETAPTCFLEIQGPGHQIKAEVKASDAGFEGRAHLQLTGKGFMHDDLRPVRITPGTRLTLQVPSVPLPNPLLGELTLLDNSGQIVCTAHL